MARVQFRQLVAKEHNLGMLAMSKRGIGRSVAAKAERAGTATSANAAVSVAGTVSVEEGVRPTDGDSSNNSSGNVATTALHVDADVRVDTDALPCSPSKNIAKDGLARAAALSIGLAGAGASDVINR